MDRELSPIRKQSVLRRTVDDVASQMKNVKTTTDERRGVATVSGERDGQRLSFTIRQSPLGEIREASVYDDLPRKSDYKDEVKRLYRERYTQQEIATMLGISQSLVSKLLRS